MTPENDISVSRGVETASMPDRPVNGLAAETSPYLLQHAHNPVDWHPWGEEAFARAVREDKPIFLSIGYSSCHWCHVMEGESFEDPETARILNERFVSIKVDREERPDVDEIYMSAVQIMTGSGGWPLSVFLTPSLEPFYGGTYFPPEDSHGQPGFRRLLVSIADLWRERRGHALENADRIAEAVRVNADMSRAGKDALSPETLSRSLAALAASFDARHGGFGGAPKFPPTGAIDLVLRLNRRQPAPETLRMAVHTLDAMAHGGIYDQLGGGFHRYSTDAQWRVPHFEKMLYDNALLARVYTDAWLVTRKPLYRRIATETLSYLVREMTDPGGGFYCAEDADSEGREGRFYLWSPAQVLKAVRYESDADLVCRYYGITRAGDCDGASVPRVDTGPEEFARLAGLTSDALGQNLARLRARLVEYRNRRARPGKDDKILAAWNGIAIGALARAYQAFGERRFLDAAQRGAIFVLNEMRTDEGRLLHVWRDGEARVAAFQDDYAHVAAALIDLYESTFEIRWLEEADLLARRMIDHFWDGRRDGLFFTSEEHPNLLARTKTGIDGATPSGNAVAALVFLRLSRLLGEADYADRARRILRVNRATMESSPRACAAMLCALDELLFPSPEIALVGPRDSDATLRILEHVYGRYLPGRCLALLDPRLPDAGRIEERIPLLRGKTTVEDRPTAYVCRNHACQHPTTDPELLAKRLEEV